MLLFRRVACGGAVVSQRKSWVQSSSQFGHTAGHQSISTSHTPIHFCGQISVANLTNPRVFRLLKEPESTKTETHTCTGRPCKTPRKTKHEKETAIHFFVAQIESGTKTTWQRMEKTCQYAFRAVKGKNAKANQNVL